MDGKCPKCQKIFADGEAALSDGLHPACPHCSVDLDMYESGENVTQSEITTREAQADEWELATARWAAGGFKADEMPDFIKENRVGEGLHAEEAFESQVTKLVENDPRESTTKEVSPDPAAEIPTREKPKKSDTIEIDLKPKKVTNQPRSKPEVERKLRAKKKKSKTRLAAGLFLALLAVFAVFWFLGDDDELWSRDFSIQGLEVTLVDAPDPDTYEAKEEALLHYGKGNQYAFQRKWRHAVLEYQTAAKLDPGYPLPYRALGSVFAAMGKPKQSISAYKTYLRLAPQSQDAVQLRRMLKNQKTQ